MKKKLKISTLIFGIIIAVIALSNSKSYADNFENTEVKKSEIQEAEMLDVIEHLLALKIVEPVQKKCTKVYNAKNQLVYECRDKDDERLKILLRRSDLVLQTGTSSYYLLGE